MNISDFARQRGVQPQTVSIYINRHKKDFADHVSNDGKAIILDAEAIHILEKKYPLPVELSNTVPQEEYDELQQKYETISVVLAKTQDNLEKAQSRVERLSDKLLEAESSKLLLEDKEKQIKEKDEALAREKEKVEQLQKELEKEKNKTWWQKLRGK